MLSPLRMTRVGGSDKSIQQSRQGLTASEDVIVATVSEMKVTQDQRPHITSFLKGSTVQRLKKHDRFRVERFTVHG